jgi:hypothetical protein
MLAHSLKPKKCAMCPREFVPRASFATVCSQRCAMRKLKADAEAKKKQEREQTRERKKALETIPDLIKVAQREFNAFIRARDADRACICCGKPLGSDEVGGGFDCGHYRSVGSAPHLRFDERNAHGQTKQCNRWGAGRAVDYRLGLIGRIGLVEVEALEADNRIHKWQREELRAIAATYRTKRKELEKENA